MIVAFDPGRNIGVAFVTEAGALAWRAIVDSEALRDLAVPPGATVLVGNGTGSAALVGQLSAMGLNPELVIERATTLEATHLYFRDHPPRGWQ